MARATPWREHRIQELSKLKTTKHLYYNARCGRFLGGNFCFKIGPWKYIEFLQPLASEVWIICKSVTEGVIRRISSWF